jgi:hypothetical protein
MCKILDEDDFPDTSLKPSYTSLEMEAVIDASSANFTKLVSEYNKLVELVEKIQEQLNSHMYS